MDKAKKTPSKKAKPTGDYPPILIDLLKIFEENYFHTALECYVLNSEVTSGLPWTTYPQSYKHSPEEENIIFYIAYDNYEKNGVVNKMYIKHETIPIAFLEGILLLLPKYDAITSIKLEYCKLTSNEIEFLQSILTEFQQIFDLSLDGNPNQRQNFAVVLQGTNIKYLSLKRCQINEYGMELLCKNLWHSTPNKLLTLNLTGNCIDDNAVTHLANMLRQNRILRTINLADNWITDTGCNVIMSSLQSFNLTQEEIIIKRKINFVYYKQITQLIEDYKKEQEKVSENQSLSTAPKLKRESHGELLAKPKKSLQENKFTSKYSNESLSNASTESRKLYFYIQSNVIKRTHPFVDVIEKEGEVTCMGNFKLSYINLAYNKISCTGYKHIIDTISFQLYNDHLGPGLSYITIDGNADITSLEYNEIFRILMDKKQKADSYSASKTGLNRSSSKYNSMSNFA